jgi:putative membrane protein
MGQLQADREAAGMLSTTLPTVVASAGDEHWVVAPFFWALWIGVIVTAVWFFARRKPRWRGDDRAKAILAERFARGDISAEEFRERLDLLG